MIFSNHLLLCVCFFSSLVAAASPRRKGQSGGRTPPFSGRLSSPIHPTSVWPQPQSMSLGSSQVWLDSSFEFNCQTSLCPYPLDDAFSRYDGIIFFAGTPAVLPTGAVAITGLNITVLADVPLALGVSENYTLTLPSTSGVAVATADTQWAALRALETFSQLFQWSGNSIPTSYGCAQAPVMVNDYPRWPWRSVLIDSSRHFLTTSAVKITLDAMAYNKLNTLHWHLVDDNSWPLYSTTLPLMSEKGAYSPEATYSHADIEDVVRYAAQRGIRIVPEFDMPAHAAIWGVGYPQFTISCKDGQTLLNPTPNAGLYEAIDSLLGEFLPLFRTDFIHFGGDEVSNLQCWLEDPGVQLFMTAQGYTTVDQVRNYFEGRIQQIGLKWSADTIIWEEVFDKNYTTLNTSIVDIWLSYDEVEKAVKSGHRLVSSFGLYLDQQDPFGPSHYFWADTWSNFFRNDPTSGRNFTWNEQQLILGESLSQWGEQCDDQNIESRMWPRACGGAERMWSAPCQNNTCSDADVAAAEPRIEAQRCHMIQRGIGAGPIRPSSEYFYCPIPLGRM
jgi:hexosaminidase